MRRFIGLLLAGAVALLVLAGCPKQKTGDATGGGKAPSPEATKAKMQKMQGSTAPQPK